MYCRLETSDGSGSKNFDPGRVKFLLLRLGRVSHFWFGYRFGKFPLKCQMFQFFALWVKKNLIRSGGKVPGSELGQPLIYCGSKVCSGWVRSEPISTGNNLLVGYISLMSLCLIYLQNGG